MSKLQMKMLSSLEKCFWDDSLENKQEKNSFKMFRNERLSFQVGCRYLDNTTDIQRWAKVELGGSLAKYAKLRMVENVPNMYPTLVHRQEGEFLRTEPGLYPDLIRPLVYPDAITLPYNQTKSLWIDIELPENFEAGEYDISPRILSGLKTCVGEFLGEVTGKVTVLDEELPKQTLIHTEWFYTDCIAEYYHVKAFSEKHWKLIENYLRTAVKNGINMILTPVFTPELDTYIGGERLTTQLVEMELLEDGTYRFGFEKLRRWVDLCLRCGVEYFEIPHFFSQWGATATPKIVVKVRGKKKKYFGWHTDSASEEYATFLSQFIPALLNELRELGVDQKCYFHISDEPHITQIESYRRCKEMIAPYLKGYPIIDALSDIEFYKTGILEHPVPCTSRATVFSEAGVKNLWTYYCGGGGLSGISDRGVAMPSWRTRILGVQLYYYNIEGFLHWGYNFYNSCKSYQRLDPYGSPDGCYFQPTGDLFLVYPGVDGEAWETLRLNALREAMDDIGALRLYESRFGRDATEKLILEHTEGVLNFNKYPTDPNYLINLRERIANAFLK